MKDYLEDFEEFTTAKGWELEKDKFFVDATPEKLKSYFRSKLKQLLKDIKAEMGEERYGNDPNYFDKYGNPIGTELNLCAYNQARKEDKELIDAKLKEL